MPQFTWLTLSQAKAALAQRLADPNMVFWTAAELTLYIQEALRNYNAFVSLWNQDYALNLGPVITQNWYQLSSISGYPRERTVTDVSLFTIMAYHLLELPAMAGGGYGFNYGFNYGIGSNGVATGQFTLDMFAAALQRRRDEIIQLTACNLAQLDVVAAANVRRTNLPDNVLEPIRNRFVPADPDVDPSTLWRDDNLAFQYFQPGYLQNQSKIGQAFPSAYSVITGPPLAIDVDFVPPSPGVYDLIVLESGPVLAPPASTILGLPDDWCWLAKWGALSDLLAMESEATDIPRAQYCLERYKEGLKLMAKSPWLLMGNLDGVPTDTVAVTEMDQFAAEWDSNPNAPECLVTAGTDFLALSPIPTGNKAAGLTVVGNAPIPVDDADFVQVSRDTWDIILDKAQSLAAFKQGGQEFAQSIELEKNFIMRCAEENGRIGELGLYREILLQEGNREKETQPRFPED
jgi:hypothetical protein